MFYQNLGMCVTQTSENTLFKDLEKHLESEVTRLKKLVKSDTSVAPELSPEQERQLKQWDEKKSQMLASGEDVDEDYFQQVRQEIIGVQGSSFTNHKLGLRYMYVKEHGDGVKTKKEVTLNGSKVKYESIEMYLSWTSPKEADKEERVNNFIMPFKGCYWFLPIETQIRGIQKKSGVDTLCESHNYNRMTEKGDPVKLPSWTKIGCDDCPYAPHSGSPEKCKTKRILTMVVLGYVEEKLCWVGPFHMEISGKLLHNLFIEETSMWKKLDGKSPAKGLYGLSFTKEPMDLSKKNSYVGKNAQDRTEIVRNYQQEKQLLIPSSVFLSASEISILRQNDHKNFILSKNYEKRRMNAFNEVPTEDESDMVGDME